MRIKKKRITKAKDYSKLNLEDFINPNPKKLFFPPLLDDLLAAALQSQPWIQRIETGWNITGLEISDEQIPDLFVSLLYRCDRELFSKVIYCCWEMGEDIFNQLKDVIINQFKRAFDFYGPDKIVKNRYLFYMGNWETKNYRIERRA
ncbi:MAG: hypothetical protein ACTSO7_15840 [Candidatus Heimdallarchaeota archaeon]